MNPPFGYPDKHYQGYGIIQGPDPRCGRFAQTGAYSGSEDTQDPVCGRAAPTGCCNTRALYVHTNVEVSDRCGALHSQKTLYKPQAPCFDAR